MMPMTLPLALTVSRLAAAPIIGVLLVVEWIPLRVAVAGPLFVAAALTDFFDGRLARKRNQTSALGAFIDPLADKLLVYVAFIYLTAVLAYPVWLLLVLFTRDMAVDSLRAFAVGKGISMPANAVGKWKSWGQMVSIALLLLLGGVTQLQRATEWGNAALSDAIASQPFEALFGVSYWLMVIAAAVGVVSMVQYFVEMAPKLFAPSSVRS